jgi:hypothetical protein
VDIWLQQVAGMHQLFSSMHTGTIWAGKRSPIIQFKLESIKSCFLHCYREDSEILGSHLLIHGVRKEDFGQYICQISNTWFQSVDTSVWLRETGKERL